MRPSYVPALPGGINPSSDTIHDPAVSEVLLKHLVVGVVVGGKEAGAANLSIEHKPSVE